jgi:vacuolar-type H+-ATPase subunit D/Vma8
VTALRVPPGRAGRLRLKHRLAIAERGADLLEQKLRALLAEQTARHAAARTSGQAWRDGVAQAETWLLRAALLGGQQDLHAVTPPAEARADLEWTTSMGVRYPGAARAVMAERSTASAGSASSALIRADAAYRRAVEAALTAAADQAAVRALDGAVDTTRRQVRALRRHWIPRLRDAVAHVDFTLEQADHEDGVRRRMTGARQRSFGSVAGTRGEQR